MSRVILLLVGLGLLVAAVALRTLHGRRFARLTGPRKCGGCAHELAPGQDRCPECGRAWAERDPGAARVFGAVADRCERTRRAVLVLTWGLIAPGSAAVVMGLLYATGTLPWAPATNAWWAAPVQVPKTGEDWQPGDAEFFVLVQGALDSQDGFEPGAPMDRIDQVTVALSGTAERTMPATGIMNELDGTKGVTFRRRGDNWSIESVRPASDPDRPRESNLQSVTTENLESLRAQTSESSEYYYGWYISYPLSIAIPELSTAERQATQRTCNLIVEALLGADLRGNIRWGEKHSGFTPPDVAARAASVRHQLAMSAVALAIAAAVALTAWWNRARAMHGSSHRGLRYDLGPTT